MIIDVSLYLFIFICPCFALVEDERDVGTRECRGHVLTYIMRLGNITMSCHRDTRSRVVVMVPVLKALLVVHLHGSTLIRIRGATNRLVFQLCGRHIEQREWT